MRIEKILMAGGKLNPKQNEFVRLLETKTIIAGPGSGKTTTLSLKIALILSYLIKNNIPHGICVITHTNVAVNEINNALERAGVGKLKHPHFIGTIHEFFNKFCVIPYFKRYHKNSSFFFAKVHNNVDSYVSMLSRSYPWMNPGVKRSIAERTENSYLVFNESTKCFELENTSTWEKFDNHKTKMLNITLNRKTQGYLTFDDTFLFSKAYLQDNNVVKILRTRFKYIFIDEYQDTHKDGEKLIDLIYKDPACTLQKIGDPYQTIGYGQSVPEVQEDEVFRLNLSVRFGKEIADQLNIIIPEASIRTVENKNSFRPIIFRYQQHETICNEYKKYVESLHGISDDYDGCRNIDSILVLRKISSEHYLNKVYNKDQKNVKESPLISVKTTIVDFLHKKIISSDPTIDSHQLKKSIRDHDKLKEANQIILELLRSENNEPILTSLKNCMNDVIEEYKIQRINITNSIFRKIIELLTSYNNVVPRQVANLEILSGINTHTIHSVKGETHRSVLLLDELENKTLTKILVDQISEKPKESAYNDEDIINRNLLYVAMSRPTHLFVFAMHEDDLSSELVQKFEKSGWDIIDV
jgi:DNA helicase-2/ATP-dependent DNA helicase PcrA